MVTRLRKRLEEFNRMAELLPDPLFDLRGRICRRLSQEQIDYTCCEQDGNLVFTVFYEEARNGFCDATFSVSPEGALHIVGKDWTVPADKLNEILLCLLDGYEYTALRRSDPFALETDIFMSFGAQIGMLLQTPELAAAFCLQMAEEVARASAQADQTIFLLLNPLRVYRGEDG